MRNWKKNLSLSLLGIWIVACSDSSTDTELPKPEPNPESVVKNGSLSGKIIGTEWSVDYGNQGAVTDKVNTKENVFDGNFNTFFASYVRSGTWVGLDLGEKHVINKIGYSPRLNQKGRVRLAVIEGANKEDFSDAVPIYVIKEDGVEKQMTYA